MYRQACTPITEKMFKHGKFLKNVSSIVPGKILGIIAWMSTIKLEVTKCLFINTTVFLL